MTHDTTRAADPWRRLAPFLDLLDARYLPLLLVVAPQAWTVTAWLERDGSPPWVALMGGLGYEAVYVGAVAWAERGAGWRAAKWPAGFALLFSVAVAVAYYGERVGALALLHAGFPLVAYAYTRLMHGDTPERVTAAETVAPAPVTRQEVRQDAPPANVVALRPARQRRATSEQEAVVRRLVAQGLSASEAAQRAGVKPRTAQRWVKEG